MDNTTQKLADFCIQTNFEQIPTAVVERAKLLILDTVGIMIRARHDSESTPSMLAAVSKLGLDRGDCHVFGDKTTYSPSAAALINASLAHSLDFDDTHAEASIHASAPIVPAVIAAAEMVGASGRDLITACVVGYEVHVRLGSAVGAADHYTRGFHPTATCGIYAAVAAVSKILKLSDSQIVSAFGIALSQTAGAMQFLNDGAWTKRLHVGQAAQNGLMAAFFASEGYVGPKQSIEGKWGFFHNYSTDANRDTAVSGLGEIWKTMTLGVKPYPSCRYSHAAIDGILALAAENNLPIDSDVKIEVGLPQRGFGIIGDPLSQKQTPRSIVDGQFSMPFSAAVAFRKRRFVWDDYADNLGDAATLALCKNVHVYVDAEAEACSPENMSANVRIISGKDVFQTFTKVPLGEPDNFMSAEEFREKFTGLCIPYMTSQQIHTLSNDILALDSYSNFADALFV